MALLKSTQIANATTLNATTSYTFKADGSQAVSVQAVWTVTTASATATLQFSNDNANWENFTTGTAITATGSKAWAIGMTADAMYWRVLYTHSSGASDTFKVYVANYPRR